MDLHSLIQNLVEPTNPRHGLVLHSATLNKRRLLPELLPGPPPANFFPRDENKLNSPERGVEETSEVGVATILVGSTFCVAEEVVD